SVRNAVTASMIPTRPRLVTAIVFRVGGSTPNGVPVSVPEGISGAATRPEGGGVQSEIIFSTRASRLGLSRTTIALAAVTCARYLQFSSVRRAVTISVKDCGVEVLGK